jgi:hypothetical protein
VVRCYNGLSFRLFFFLHSYLQGLTPRYPELFESNGGDTGQHEQNFARKWRGYTSIVQLANEDITKFDEILERPLEECLLYLAYTQDKAQLESLLHKQMLSKYKN